MLKCWDIVLLSVDERQCWFIGYKRSGANGCYIRLVLVDPGLGHLAAVYWGLGLK